MVSQLIAIWGRWQATRITKLLQISVRKKIFDHAVRLPLHRVYDLKSGGAPSLIREDAGAVGELVFGMLYNPWRAIIQLIGILVILAATNWKLLVGSLVIIPAVWLSHRTWINRIRPIFSDIRATRTRTDAHATEAFSGIRVVRGFARQHGESARFTRNQDLMARQEILSWWWMRIIEIVWKMIIPTAIAMLIWFGGSMVLHDHQLVAAGVMKPMDAFTIGGLTMFISYLFMLLGPLEALANSATQFQNSLAGLDRVLNVLAEPIEMPSKPGSRLLSRDTPPARIKQRGVGFSYPNAPQPVLEEINLDADPGEMIALVGHSGAGKTTLCNLIARFYDPTEGSIRFGGVDLRDIDVDSYRTLLGIVEQDTFLFDGSVADNIAYGRRNATMEEVIAAAKQANAHEFIAVLPKGYQSIIGERGVKLSGGQRQRLTIARAILADPRILILDEATSNLDTESERLIQSSLATLMTGRTSFVIAHRLSTIAHAHRIVVLEHGRIIETGRHDELMARSGRYRQMVELQTSPVAASAVGVWRSGDLKSEARHSSFLFQSPNRQIAKSSGYIAEIRHFSPTAGITRLKRLLRLADTGKAAGAVRAWQQEVPWRRNPVPKRLPPRHYWLLRGESIIASVGISVAAILMAAMAASGWWTLRTQREAFVADRVEQVRALGQVLSRSAESMLANNDLSSLRRMMPDAERSYNLTSCEIAMPNGKIVASSDPAKITQVSLPGRWAAEPMDTPTNTGNDKQMVLSFPLRVMGRGAAELQLSAGVQYPLHQLLGGADGRRPDRGDGAAGGAHRRTAGPGRGC